MLRGRRREMGCAREGWRSQAGESGQSATSMEAVLPLRPSFLPAEQRPERLHPRAARLGSNGQYPMQ